MTNETEVERWTRPVAGAEVEVLRYQQDGPREHIREARDALDDARISLVRAKEAEAAEQPGLRLKPCPFCGGPAQIERFGNTRVSTIYACDECGCRLETGEEFRHGRSWNRRANDQTKADLTDALSRALAEMKAFCGSHSMAEIALAEKVLARAIGEAGQ